MKAKDYRRTVERNVELARLRQQEKQLESATQANIMQQALRTQTALLNEEDGAVIEQLVADKQTDTSVRAAAILRLGFGDDARVNLEQLIAIVADKDESIEVRRNAIRKLEANSFERADFVDVRPSYFSALRSCLDELDVGLISDALGVLSSYRDTYAQEKLFAWLQDMDSCPLPQTSVLQFLSYDIHAGVHDAAKKILDTTNDEDTKLEALRLLSSDGGSLNQFQQLLRDKSETLGVRRIAAAACKSLAPEQFQNDAMLILEDEDEDEGLRMTALSGLAHSDAFVAGDEIKDNLKNAITNTASTLLQNKAAAYLGRALIARLKK